MTPEEQTNKNLALEYINEARKLVNRLPNVARIELDSNTKAVIAKAKIQLDNAITALCSK
jgi:ribosomal protein S3AE